jgi:porphobilinogen synthase
MVNHFPTMRQRRLRSSPAMRDLLQENIVSVNDLIYPIFVEEELDDFAPVESMPGVFRIPERKLDVAVKEIAAAGIKAVMTFGVSHHKDDIGSDAWNRDGLVARIIKRTKDAAPGLMVISDTCFCEYTSHGHCGVVARDGAHYEIENDASVRLLAKAAVSLAVAGADIVAPSDMMDGRVEAIREALDAGGASGTPILSYASKFASAFYGPFREAADSAPQFGDRRSYQMDGANLREAMREIDQDIAEGADMVLMKPAMPYLDVIRAARERYDVPLGAYQVSGEYAMLQAAFARGWLEPERAMLESLTSIRRAGADFIVTYFAKDASQVLG